MHEIKGLSKNEVEKRQHEGLINTPSKNFSQSYLQVIWRNISNPYNLVLLIAFLILLFLRGLNTSIFTASALLLNICVGLIQEIRAKSSLDKLALLNRKKTIVIRDGHETDVFSDEIVKDDIVKIEPGALIPVDGHIVVSHNLEIDESAITGESESVAKRDNDAITSGSYCIAGDGYMIAEKLGDESYASKLVRTASKLKVPKTPTEIKLNKVLIFLSWCTVIIAPITFLAGVRMGIPIDQTLENIINAISSTVPQGLAISINILFVLSALSISRKYALMRQVNTVESLGYVNILCIDKTGTITSNNLKVHELLSKSMEFKTTLAYFAQNASGKNKTLQAIDEYFQNSETKIKSSQAEKISEIAFNSTRKWSAITTKDATYLLGASEKLLYGLKVTDQIESYTQKGLRVLAFVKTHSHVIADVLPKDLELLGMIILEDEIRQDMKETLHKFNELGIKIKVISGDNSQTVAATARNAGINFSDIATEDTLKELGTAAFDERIKSCNLFARITPTMKQKIVKSLKKQGFHVAMTGDGVNDVPALKQADVAICMNSGAQIAKDVSTMILLENSISTLPNAISEGRDATNRILTIAKIYLCHIFSISMIYFVGGIFALPFAFNIVQASWISLISISVPVYLIAFKAFSTYKIDDFDRDIVRFAAKASLIGAIIPLFMQLILLYSLGLNALTISKFMMIFMMIFHMFIFYAVLKKKSVLALAFSLSITAVGILVGIAIS